MNTQERVNQSLLKFSKKIGLTKRLPKLKIHLFLQGQNRPSNPLAPMRIARIIVRLNSGEKRFFLDLGPVEEMGLDWFCIMQKKARLKLKGLNSRKKL